MVATGVVAFMASIRTDALICPSIVAKASSQSSHSQSSSSHSSSVLSMGLLDDLQLIFSDEGKKNRAAYEARQRAEQEAAQAEVLERRRNPDLMRAYERDVAEKRTQLQEERNVWDFQTKKAEAGYDPLTEWTRLREEGKITVGSDLERDPESARWGSEGLVEVRVDERLPYIDQGYVDESADLMGGFMKLFGGGGGNNKKARADDGGNSGK